MGVNAYLFVFSSIQPLVSCTSSSSNYSYINYNNIIKYHFDLYFLNRDGGGEHK